MTRLQVAAVVVATAGTVLWLLALAGFVVADYVHLRPWWELRFVLAFAGSVAFVAAWAMAVRHSVLTPIGIVAFVALALVTVGFGWLADAFATDEQEVSRVAAPDGAMAVVVSSGSGFLSPDPWVLLHVETNDGIRSREVDIGCVNVDAAPFERVEWTDARTLRVILSADESYDIAIDSRGEPDRTLRRGC